MNWSSFGLACRGHSFFDFFDFWSGCKEKARKEESGAPQWIHPLSELGQVRQATRISLKTLASLNKEVWPFFLSDNSIWSVPSVSSLSDYTAFGGPEGYFSLAIIAFGAFQFIVPKYYYRFPEGPGIEKIHSRSNAWKKTIPPRTKFSFSIEILGE